MPLFVSEPVFYAILAATGCISVGAGHAEGNASIIITGDGASQLAVRFADAWKGI